MKNEDDFPWGAKIERGRIAAIEKTEQGRFLYSIESIDRPGAAFYNMPGDEAYTIQTMVYFFAFEDGKGMILRSFT